MGPDGERSTSPRPKRSSENDFAIRIAPGSGEDAFPFLVGVGAALRGRILGLVAGVASRRTPSGAGRRPEQRETLIARRKDDLAVAVRNLVAAEPQRLVLCILR